jgi:hypothetical protein
MLGCRRVLVGVSTKRRRMETEGSWPLRESESARPHGYEKPRVEQVLTLGDLEREVLYAGPVDGTTLSDGS